MFKTLIDGPEMTLDPEACLRFKSAMEEKKEKKKRKRYKLFL